MVLAGGKQAGRQQCSDLPHEGLSGCGRDVKVVCFHISENHANFSFQKTLKEVHFNALIGDGLDEQDSLLLVLVEIEDC